MGSIHICMKQEQQLQPLVNMFANTADKKSKHKYETTEDQDENQGNDDEFYTSLKKS